MKKIIYITTGIIMFVGGIYTTYGEFKSSEIAKKNLYTMNKSHLFASVINTTNNSETFNGLPQKKEANHNDTQKTTKKTSKKVNEKSQKITKKMLSVKKTNKETVKKVLRKK